VSVFYHGDPRIQPQTTTGTATTVAPPETALDGEAEITLKAPADLAAALADADPRGGWIATPAAPQAARAKADILIEAVGASYDPALLLDAPWGGSTDGVYAILAADTVQVDARTVPALSPTALATVASPRDLSWTAVAAAHPAYLVVDPAQGSATLVIATALTGVEPDEID
jgi:hypothetical protein